MENEWIEWAGGECPVEREILIDARLRDGTTMHNEMAGDFCPLDKTADASNCNFMHDGGGLDIIAYRIAEPLS